MRASFSIKKVWFKSFLSLFVLSLFYQTSFAGDLNWSGKYSAESNLLKNPFMNSPKKEISYLDHHLVLSPMIIAADGINIYSRFDIFNNSNFANSQFGEFLGGSNTGTSNHGITGELDSGTLAVSDLYLTWSQEYGSFIVGRAPVHFGLGVSHNAGLGDNDHWISRKDLIGYKMIVGNMYFMPSYGKVKEGDPAEDDDIKDYMFQWAYENLDTDLEIGFFAQIRKANAGANDIGPTPPATTDIFNVLAKRGDKKLNIKSYNLFVKRKLGNFSFSLEGAMQSGDTGLVLQSTSQGIELDAYAIMAEMGYKKENSKWTYDLKLGSISGDDLNTLEKYEGFLVDRNYKVSLILFNYMLGASSSSILGNENYIRATTKSQSVDVGQMTNALYLAPGFNWTWNDRWGMDGRFTYARLNQALNGQSKDLGYEFDFGIHYSPFERVHMRMDGGYLVAGDAFKGVTSLKTSNVYGLMFKTSVSF